MLTQCRIQLLDGQTMELCLKPGQRTSNLLDIIAAYHGLVDKEFFGLCHRDDRQHAYWLVPDKSIAEHPFLQGLSEADFHYGVRHYSPSISFLKDPRAVELLALQGKLSLTKNQLGCSENSRNLLIAYILQASVGDYRSTKEAIGELRLLSLYPEQGSASVNMIMRRYQQLAGVSRDDAILGFLRLLEAQPGYGMQYYAVSDRFERPLELGISFRGISMFLQSNRDKPALEVPWKQMCHIHCGSRKFSLEFQAERREDIMTHLSSLTCTNPALATKTTRLIWFASSHQLAREIWCNAKVQHEFYEKRLYAKHGQCQDLDELGQKLSELPSSLLEGSLYLHDDFQIDGGLAGEHDCATIQKRYDQLEARRLQLGQLLKARTQEYSNLGLEEEKITGMPPSTTPVGGKFSYATSASTLNRVHHSSPPFTDSTELCSAGHQKRDARQRHLSDASSIESSGSINTAGSSDNLSRYSSRDTIGVDSVADPWDRGPNQLRRPVSAPDAASLISYQSYNYFAADPGHESDNEPIDRTLVPANPSPPIPSSYWQQGGSAIVGADPTDSVNSGAHPENSTSWGLRNGQFAPNISFSGTLRTYDESTMSYSEQLSSSGSKSSSPDHSSATQQQTEELRWVSGMGGESLV